MDSTSPTSIFAANRPKSRYREREALEPADDLFEYLRHADIGIWGNDERASGGWWGRGRKGLGDMSWEWGRRWREAEAARTRGRVLRVWESGGKGWERKILECEYRPSGAIACT